jgi:hypothetical protein
MLLPMSRLLPDVPQARLGVLAVVPQISQKAEDVECAVLKMPDFFTTNVENFHEMQRRALCSSCKCKNSPGKYEKRPRSMAYASNVFERSKT